MAKDVVTDGAGFGGTQFWEMTADKVPLTPVGGSKRKQKQKKAEDKAETELSKVAEGGKRRLSDLIDLEHEDRANALEDFRFVAGDQWPEYAKRDRTAPGQERPMLTINRTAVFVHQIVNDQRQARPNVKVHPVDSGADPATARIRQGLLMHTDQTSDAQKAYDMAFEHTVKGGRGFWIVRARYESEMSFNQKIAIEPCESPFGVYVGGIISDDYGEHPAYGFVTTTMSKDEFESKYKGKAGIGGAIANAPGDGEQWLTKDQVRVSEYHVIEQVPCTIAALPDGTVCLLEEVPDGVTPLDTRETTRRKSMVYVLAGGQQEPIDSWEFPAPYIGIIPVEGESHVIDGKKSVWGLVRRVRDPAQMYNFWMTSATEEVALRHKAPYIGAEGQFTGHEDEWAAANTSPAPYVEYKPTSHNGQLVPPPQRQAMADVPTGHIQMAMHAADDIKASSGIFDASLGARGNEQSGKAIMARQREGDTANFHFIDNFNRALQHSARVQLAMIPRIYDTERVLRIIGDDGQEQMTRVNVRAVDTVLNDMTVGRYDVTISTGPSYSTQRQEALDALMEMSRSNPAMWQMAGDVIVKQMDWPGADQLAERLRRTIPPQLLDGEEGAPQIPPQVQQQVAQMQEMIQQLQGQLQQAGAALQDKSDKASNEQQRFALDAQKLQLEEMRLQIDAAKAETDRMVAMSSAQAKAESDALAAMQPPATRQEQPESPEPAQPINITVPVHIDSGNSARRVARMQRLPDGSFEFVQETIPAMPPDALM